MGLPERKVTHRLIRNYFESSFARYQQVLPAHAQDGISGALVTIRRGIENDPDLLVPQKKVGLDRAIRSNYAYIDTRLGLRGALADMNATTVMVSSGHLGATFFSMAMQKTCFYLDVFTKK